MKESREFDFVGWATDTNVDTSTKTRARYPVVVRDQPRPSSLIFSEEAVRDDECSWLDVHWPRAALIFPQPS